MGDINYWYSLHKDLCPNCGWVLKDLHPAANLYPHFTGACKEMREKEYRAEIADGGNDADSTPRTGLSQGRRGEQP